MKIYKLNKAVNQAVGIGLI